MGLCVPGRRPARSVSVVFAMLIGSIAPGVSASPVAGVPASRLAVMFNAVGQVVHRWTVPPGATGRSSRWLARAAARFAAGMGLP